jgi:hypothetical protein
LILAAESDARLQRAAAMIAGGIAETDIATALEVPETTLAEWTQTKRFTELVASYRDADSEALASMLRIEGINTLTYVCRVRDGKLGKDPDLRLVALRLKAAFKILDKVIPDAKREQLKQETTNVLKLDGRLMGQALRAMKHAGQANVSLDEIEVLTEHPLRRHMTYAKPKEDKAD